MVDNRLGNCPRYYIGGEDDCLMRVPDEVRKCVAFACFNGKTGRALAGTVFFVAIDSREIGYIFGYAITAKHVIAGIQKDSVDGKALLRVNMKSGSSQFVETDVSAWKFHPDDSSVDVAVLPLWLPQDQVDFVAIPVELAATDPIIQKEQIDVGDDVFLTGLFVSHYGQQKNLPIVRTGNIALMPGEPVQTRDLGPVEAYLIEARSIGGLSGSPVFVHLAPATRFLPGQPPEQRMVFGSKFYWLGLMHGHWDMGLPDKDVMVEDALTNERVNMGIAIVIPATKVLEVINQEVFMKSREEEIKRRQRITLPTADTPATDALTEEEFDRTLRQVSQRVSPSEPDQAPSET